MAIQFSAHLLRKAVYISLGFTGIVGQHRHDLHLQHHLIWTDPEVNLSAAPRQ